MNINDYNPTAKFILLSIIETRDKEIKKVFEGVKVVILHRQHHEIGDSFNYLTYRPLAKRMLSILDSKQCARIHLHQNVCI